MRHDPARLQLARYSWSLEIPTRFGDLDPLGHLNNVAIAGLYEDARVRFNATFDLPRHRGAGRTVVAEVALHYLAEGRYPAPTVCAAGMLHVGNSSWTIGLALFQADRCIGLCETVLVHTEDGRPARLPDALRQAFEGARFRAA